MFIAVGKACRNRYWARCCSVCSLVLSLFYSCGRPWRAGASRVATEAGGCAGTQNGWLGFVGRSIRVRPGLKCVGLAPALLELSNIRVDFLRLVLISKMLARLPAGALKNIASLPGARSSAFNAARSLPVRSFALFSVQVTR